MGTLKVRFVRKDTNTEIGIINEPNFVNDIPIAITEEKNGQPATEIFSGVIKADGSTPPPPPPPDGTWYDSNVDGKWNNGHPRTFTDYDHDLPKPYQNGKGMITAASGDPEGEINGQGTFTLKGNGGHPRTYTDAINYTDVICEYDLRINQDGVNHTNQLQSRHQEDDKNEQDNENAFGGYNYMITVGEVELKIELYHTPSGGDHINGPNPKQNIVKVGQWVHVKNTLKVDIANKSAYMSIELNNQKVVEWTPKNLPTFAVDEIKFKQRSYFWNRMNPPGVASIDIKNQRLYKSKA